MMKFNIWQSFNGRVWLMTRRQQLTAQQAGEQLAEVVEADLELRENAPGEAEYEIRPDLIATPDDDQYERIETHEKILRSEMREEALLRMTATLDEHPEGYEGPCLCKLCCSYSGELPKGN
jgi:broad specificity phosphatase PhoE